MWRAIAQQRDGRKAAVGHRDHPPPRRPTGDLRQHLARPARELFVAPVALGSVSLGGRQHGQEGQTPDPPGPGHGREQHDAEPAQAAGLDEMPGAGADRVAVDPPRRDPGAPAPLDGVVEADHHRTVRHEGGDQQPQEPVREGARAPVPVAQRALADSKTRSLAQPHDAQRRGDGSTPRRQQGAARQHEHVTPDRGGEVASEGPRPAVQPLGNHARRHGAPPPPGSPKAGTRERGAMGDSNNAMRARIEAWPWPPRRGGAEVVRANRGHTLYSLRTGAPVARLRPPARATTSRSCGGGVMLGATQVPSAPRLCRSIRPSTSSPARGSSGSTPHDDAVTARAKPS